jgi:hypothetical protein
LQYSIFSIKKSRQAGFFYPAAKQGSDFRCFADQGYKDEREQMPAKLQ